MVYSNPPRSSKDCPTDLLSGFWIWFERKKSVLLLTAAISIVLLFVLHSSTVTMQIIPGSNLHKFIVLITIFLLLPIAISIFWKGIVPIAICALGLTLLYAGVLYPSYVTEIVGEIYYKSSYGFTTEKSILNAAHGYFFLGIGMVIFSIIIGYKPAILYTRNRPEPLDTIWQKYPIWRYEFVLTDIFGTPYLVRPDGFVPASSTIFRDKANRSMMGKAKYTGYFV
jgi:hypothetical protein